MPNATEPLREIDGNGHMPDPPARCPFTRSRSFITGEYSIQIGYAELTEIMEMVLDLWDRLSLDARDEKIGAGFNDLLEHVSGLRDWTGWAGIPGKYLVDATGPEVPGWEER